MTTVWRTASRIRAFWGFDHTMARQVEHALGLGQPQMLVLLAVEAGGYLVVMVLAFAGLWWGYARLDGPCARFLFGLVTAFQLPYSLAFASSVYHVPVMGLVIVFAGTGAEQLLSSTADRPALIARIRRPGFWISAAIFLLVQIEYAYYLVSVR